MIDESIINNLDVINYRAIELLEQLNCLEPSENLIYKAETLLRSICGEKGEEHSVEFLS